MKKYILLFSLSVIGLNSFCQSGWVAKKVGRDLSVKFPHEPNYDSKPGKRLSLYTIKSNDNNCMFSVMIRKNVIADFDRINNLTWLEKLDEISKFLDQGISQFIQHSKIISPAKSILVDDYIGKEITYSELNDHTGKLFDQFTKFVLANNDLYVFQCSVYETGNCEEEKDFFLNSVTSIHSNSKKEKVTDQIQNILAQAETIKDSYGSETVAATTSRGHFSAADYEYVPGASPYDDPQTLRRLNESLQPFSDKVVRVFKNIDNKIMGVLIGFILLVFIIVFFDLNMSSHLKNKA